MSCLARSRSAAVIALALGAFALAILAFGPLPASAHSGHDHGDDKTASSAALAATARPRVAVETDLYQLVAILSAPGRLSLFLDRTDTNAAVTDARISLLQGNEAIVAETQSDGSYALALPLLATPGHHQLVFRIDAAAGDDLVAGELDVPEVTPAVAQVASSPTWASRLGAYAPVLGALVLGIGIGMFTGRRRGVASLAVLMALAAAPTDRAQAHEGHDHSPVPNSSAVMGDLPRRMPDGSVFLPKPSQRLLSVLTVKAVEGEGRRAVSLLGRVVADPNRAGVVQSINGGRVSAPDAGFPHLGQKVTRGQVLALVTPALPLADQSTLAEKQRELEGAISLARQKLARLNRLGPNVIPRSNIEDTDLDIANLEQRLASLKQAKIAPEVLVAPVDGVLSTSRVAAGQVVAAQDSLFQVVDPASLWVEALVFDQLDPGAVVEASARTPDGRVMKLAFRGRSHALQAQSTVLQFAIEGAPADAAIGQPVTVVVQTADRVQGLLLPYEALVRGPSGEATVWLQVSPESFVARQVRSAPFDGARVLVTGLKAGDRVVVHAAELLSQIR
jgi:cobalt-zinc-cadmium efflux system membrane fusion protein